MTAADRQRTDDPSDLAARLARTERREAALAGVLWAVTEGGDDLESVLCEIAARAAELSTGTDANVFVAEGDKIAAYNFFALNDARAPQVLPRPQ